MAALSREQTDLQELRLFEVQVVQLRGGLRIGWARGRGAAQEAALGGVGDGNRRPSASRVRY